MIGGVRIAYERPDSHAVFMLLDVPQRQTIDVDKVRRTLHSHLHQIQKIRPASDKAHVGTLAVTPDCLINRRRASVRERSHPLLPRYACRMAATIPSYAPQRQMFPLIRSRISSSVS